MRTIMIMFDTLTRKFLPNYGNTWVDGPNFQRLDSHCAKFDNFYGGSMPCMPARRELHTGKYNFTHRSWGPLEPFDNSVFECLEKNGVYCHLVTDHSHYWEDGGATYHNRYDSWEGFRGQEGDRWVPHDVNVTIPENRNPLNKEGLSVAQHYRNRTRQQTKEEMSSVKTFKAGLDFIEEHLNEDQWFLQIEAFDPHEPFYVPQEFRKKYDLPEEETINWPKYGKLDEDRDYHEDIENSKREYAALISLCDESLGKVLDYMDKYNMWEDTCLIVNTDHGFLLGEHEWFGKNFPPLYDELIHTPFFMHVPKTLEGGNVDLLCNTVDIVPTLLDLYGIDTDSMGKLDGSSILKRLNKELPEKEEVLFGIHGGYSCISDGRYVYMKATENPDNQQLAEYTLMPTHIRGFFNREALKNAKLVEGDAFTNGVPVLKVPTKSYINTYKQGNRLYDIKEDLEEKNNLYNDKNKEIWNERLKEALENVETPDTEFLRLNLL